MLVCRGRRWLGRLRTGNRRRREQVRKTVECVRRTRRRRRKWHGDTDGRRRRVLGTDEGAGAVTSKAPRQAPGMVGGWKRWSNFPGPSPLVDDLRFFVFARSLADRDRDSPNSRPRWRSSLRRGRPRTSARTRSSSFSAASGTTGEIGSIASCERSEARTSVCPRDSAPAQGLPSP